MKKKLKIITFIIIFIFILRLLDRLYCPIGTEINHKSWVASQGIQKFYNEAKDTMDVMFIGDSSIYWGISPLDIYAQTGVTSYNFSNSSAKPWTLYYFTREVFKYQKPKVIFIDTDEFMANNNEKKSETIRMSIDSMKMSFNKLEMINDPNYKMTNFEKITCINKTLTYHARWSSLNEKDFEKFYINENKEKIFKGYYYDNGINKPDSVLKKDSKGITTFSEESINSIKKIKELCEKNNCQLIFISIPAIIDTDKSINRAIKKFADEINVKYINLNDESLLNIDWNTETRDKGSHLNYKGAQKVSNYIANYITNNFKFSKHNASVSEKWNEELKEFKKIVNY